MSKGVPQFYDMQVPIRAFVTKRLVGVEADKTVEEAARRMAEFNISSIVVMEEDEIVGLLTDTDLKARVVAKGLGPETPVREVMTRELIAADIGMPVREVLALMADKSIKHVLIKEEDQFVGMVTFRDLIDIELHTLETHISRE
jgi:signal-transduction protein with cAMP-binding, CBS, and nucleotidyltransferase domain